LTPARFSRRSCGKESLNLGVKYACLQVNFSELTVKHAFLLGVNGAH